MSFTCESICASAHSLISIEIRAATEPVVVWQLVSVADTRYHRVLVIDERFGGLRHTLDVDIVDAGKDLGW